MQVGIFAKTFAGKSPLPVLEAVKAAGYDSAAFNFACAGLAAMPDEVPQRVLTEIRAAVAATGNTISRAARRSAQAAGVRLSG